MADACKIYLDAGQSLPENAYLKCQNLNIDEWLKMGPKHNVLTDLVSTMQEFEDIDSKSELVHAMGVELLVAAIMTTWDLWNELKQSSRDSEIAIAQTALFGVVKGLFLLYNRHLLDPPRLCSLADRPFNTDGTCQVVYPARSRVVKK